VTIRLLTRQRNKHRARDYLPGIDGSFVDYRPDYFQAVTGESFDDVSQS